MTVEINWKELGLEPPEGEKKKSERPPERPEKSVADTKKELAAGMKSLERKYPNDAGFNPSVEMSILAKQHEGRIAELQQQRADVLSEDPAELTNFDTPERMQQIRRSRQDTLTGPLDREIAQATADQSWYDAAITDMKNGDMRAAQSFIDGKERDYAAKLGPAAKLEKQWEDYVKEMGKAGDIPKLQEALSGHQQAKAAADRIRGNLERVADQRRWLELKGERAALDKKEGEALSPDLATNFEDLKKAVAALGEIETRTGQKLTAKEVVGYIDAYANGIRGVESHIPRAHGIRDKVRELADAAAEKEAGPKKPADAATIDELKAAVAALPELKTSDGRALNPKEVAAMIDNVRNGVALSYLPRAEGIRDKMKELMEKEGKG